MAKEIPILFSTPMVQAIMDGRKTQTRRIIKNHTAENWNEDEMEGIHHAYKEWFNEDTGKMEPPEWLLLNGDGDVEDILGQCRYGKQGDILWVRETFISGYKMEDASFLYDEHGEQIPHTWYRATDPNMRWYDGTSDFPVENVPWKPSIHMPKWAARIWLQVEDVRVERLQDISASDVIREGIHWDDKNNGWRDYRPGYENCVWQKDYPVDSFWSLWSSINGTDSWRVNPWVFVISFKVLSTTGRPADYNLP